MSFVEITPTIVETTTKEKSMTDEFDNDPFEEEEEKPEEDFAFVVQEEESSSAIIVAAVAAIAAVPAAYIGGKALIKKAKTKLNERKSPPLELVHETEAKESTE